MLKRRDFTFRGLLEQRDKGASALSDLGKDVFIPRPAQEYPVHFLEIAMTNSNSYNLDVLSCLANLSSDEVFTPPHLQTTFWTFPRRYLV